MEFNPAIHTKEFLLQNIRILMILSSMSVGFSLSPLAQDIEILSVKNAMGCTPAHYLAEHQPLWVNTDAAKNYSVLLLKNNHGASVAHHLAKYQPQWMFSEAVKDQNILKLKNNDGQSVAHTLAMYQPQWLSAEASKDIAILQLQNKTCCSVAHILAKHQHQWIHSNASKDKAILELKGENGASVAQYLATYQPRWLYCDTAKEKGILQIEGEYGSTTAHYLAIHQPEWVHSDAAKNLCLQWKNDFGITVAHLLARHQAIWVDSDAAKDKHTLNLSSDNGLSVAHMLAEYQPEWVFSAAASDKAILLLKDDVGISVASKLISHPACLSNELLFHKDILALKRTDGILDEYRRGNSILAEEIAEKYEASHGLDVPTMAMKLISQGGAYKHSKPLPYSVGRTVQQQTMVLIDDSCEPEIALRYAQALYSTLFHAVNTNNKMSADTEHNKKWNSLLSQSMKYIRDILQANPSLCEKPHQIDIFCEPANELMNDLIIQIESQKVFAGSNLEVLLSIDKSEETAAKIALY
jgi:hypothetical protein